MVVDFDEDGKLTILNISKHPIHRDFSYMHALYYTNFKMYQELKPHVEKIIQAISNVIPLKNIALHAEFKLQNNTLIPVEINPLRFGGFGYSDISSHWFSINSYTSFFEGLQLTENAIWDNVDKSKSYAWILLYNGKNVDVSKQIPEYDKLNKMFNEILHIEKLDYLNNPAFGIAYVKDLEENLLNVLQLDFNEFFK